MVSNIKNKLLYNLSKQILRENIEYKNIYQDEECYIFGNGISLKWYDLNAFSDKKSLVCSWMYLHKQYESLNVVADIELHPFCFYPYWKNVYSGKIEKNLISKLYHQSGKFSKDYPVFVSLSNYPSLKSTYNVKYLHHFNNRDADICKCSLDSVFSFMEDSLRALLGIALYMGFKKVTLVGMDYLYDNPRVHHFFEKGKGIEISCTQQKIYKDVAFFDKLSGCFEVELLLPEWSKSTRFSSISYNNISNNKEKYHKNNELVDESNLQSLSLLGLQYQIY